MSSQPVSPVAVATTPPRIFVTTVPGQAAFLIVTSRADMRYIGAEQVRGNQVAFSFEDPKDLGPSKMAEYKQSILREYTEVHKFLRDEIRRVMRVVEPVDVQPVR